MKKGFLGFVLLIMTCFKSCFLSLIMSAEKLFLRVTFSTDTLEFHNNPSLFNCLFSRLQYRDVFKCIYFGLIFKTSLIPTPSRLLYLLNWNFCKRSKFVIYQKVCHKRMKNQQEQWIILNSRYKRGSYFLRYNDCNHQYNITSLLDELTSSYTILGLKKTNTYPSPLLAKKKEEMLAPGSRTRAVVNLTIVN